VSIDYNQPATNWGNTPVVTYTSRDTVTVQWCVDHNGDHGGMFSYRICQDQSVIDALITSGYLPTDAEKQAAEDCFEVGTLDCTDVLGQMCGCSAECTAGEACYRNDWFTCNGFEADTLPKCQGVDNSAFGELLYVYIRGLHRDEESQIPDYTSNHTLLSLRWNPFQTG
jgi:hypothetical protein